MFWLTNRHSRQDKEEIFKLMVGRRDDRRRAALLVAGLQQRP